MTSCPGRSRGSAAFVEVQWKDSFYMDNANLLKAPGYELVNLNVHYRTDLVSDYFQVAQPLSRGAKRVRPNLCRLRQQYREYARPAGVQNTASVLANTTGSIYAGSPRAFIAGMKVAFK